MSPVELARVRLTVHDAFDLGVKPHAYRLHCPHRVAHARAGVAMTSTSRGGPWKACAPSAAHHERRHAQQSRSVSSGDFVSRWSGGLRSTSHTWGRTSTCQPYGSREGIGLQAVPRWRTPQALGMQHRLGGKATAPSSADAGRRNSAKSTLSARTGTPLNVVSTDEQELRQAPPRRRLDGHHKQDIAASTHEVQHAIGPRLLRARPHTGAERQLSMPTPLPDQLARRTLRRSPPSQRAGLHSGLVEQGSPTLVASEAPQSWLGPMARA